MSSLNDGETVLDKAFGPGVPLYEEGSYLSVIRHKNGAAEGYVSTRIRRNPAHHLWWPDRNGRYRRPRIKDDGAEAKPVNVDRAVRRAKKRVRELVSALACDHMLTLTYRENMQDPERAKADWERFVRLVRLKKNKWFYVSVLEVQERGALHIHVACCGRQDVRYLRQCWWAVVGNAQGNIDVSGPRKRWGSECDEWKMTKLSGYLTKYLSKAFADGEAWAKRYWHSRLDESQRPVKEVYWLQAFDGVHLIQQVYEIVAGSRAIGVVQHVLPGEGTRYWLSVPPHPRTWGAPHA